LKRIQRREKDWRTYFVDYFIVLIQKSWKPSRGREEDNRRTYEGKSKFAPNNMQKINNLNDLDTQGKGKGFETRTKLDLLTGPNSIIIPGACAVL
jgi:hypothetical protein